MKQFLRSNSEKILIVSLSKFKSSPFSLIYTKEDGSEEESPVKNIEYESLTKKLVKLHIIRLNILE
jgi:hypothetical protein